MIANFSLGVWVLLSLLLAQGSSLAISQEIPDRPVNVDSQKSSSGPEHVALPDEPSASASQSTKAPSSDAANNAPDYGQQTKRILYVVPNFHSVSAGTQLAAQTARGKLMNATEDTFDYSNFLFIGALSGIQQAQGATREFGQGARGYGRYYWHSFVDQGDENYFVEGFMPILFRQDTRYYTLGRGGFLRRVSYAMSRGLITRSDTGAPEPNYSEIIGAGAAAGISNLYYPGPERSWTKTGQRWVTSVGLDVMTQAFREFWPDIHHKLFRR